MSQDIAQLQAEIERLTTENAHLREHTTPTAKPKGKRRWRAALSVVAFALAAVLIPVAILGTWTRAQLVDEQRFVATFAPLAADPAVQAVVVSNVDALVQEQLDIESLTDTLFDGIASLDLPPAAENALNLLRVPAAAGAKSLVTSTITKLVDSDAFEDVWERSLAATHRALVAAATNTDADAISISDAGELGIQTGPIIEELKAVLTAQGFGFANAIPTINATIVVAQADALALIGPLYALAASVGFALPWVALVVLFAGIFLARRLAAGTLGAGVTMLVGGALTAAAISGGSSILALQGPALNMPANALTAVYGYVTGSMQNTAIVVAVLGGVVAIMGWLMGSSRPARRIRQVSGSLTGSARTGLQSRGMSTGSVGVWLYQQRLFVRVAIAVLAIVVLVFAPLTLGVVLWTAALALLVWLVVELLARHPEDAPAASLDEAESSA